jgi:hypothetical protein
LIGRRKPMAKTYANADDVFRRLQETIVFYKGRPYFVSVNNENWKKVTLTDYTNLLFKNPEKHLPITIAHDDKELDTSAPQLGNINHEGNVSYVSRRPLRRQNQGLIIGNCYTNPKLHGGWYYTRGVWEMLMNIYPSQEEALEKVRQLEARRVAISRTISIGFVERSSDIAMYLGSSAGHKLIATLDRFERFKLIEGEDTSFIRRFLNRTGVVRNVA